MKGKSRLKKNQPIYNWINVEEKKLFTATVSGIDDFWNVCTGIKYLYSSKICVSITFSRALNRTVNIFSVMLGNTRIRKQSVRDFYGRLSANNVAGQHFPASIHEHWHETVPF